MDAPLSPSAMQFGPHAADATDLPDVLQAYGDRLYLEAWAAYLKAGCPLGDSDLAMLVWYTFEEPTSEALASVTPN